MRFRVCNADTSQAAAQVDPHAQLCFLLRLIAEEKTGDLGKPAFTASVLEIAIVLLLVVTNGVFALSELAIVSARRSRLTAMAAEGRRGARWAPDGVKVRNPAFDVTPAYLVTAIVTEAGVLRPLFPDAIASVTRRETVAR